MFQVLLCSYFSHFTYVQLRTSGHWREFLNHDYALSADTIIVIIESNYKQGRLEYI